MRFEEVPGQSTLWRAWNDRFTDELRDSCRRAAQRIVEVARENGIPAPDTVFQPEKKQDVEERSERRLIADKIKKVWQQAKPFLIDSFHLKRGQNAQIPEAARSSSGARSISTIGRSSTNRSERAPTTSRDAKRSRSKRATQERIENGYDHGRSPFGLTYDGDAATRSPATTSTNTERRSRVSDSARTAVHGGRANVTM